MLAMATASPLSASNRSSTALRVGARSERRAASDEAETSSALVRSSGKKLTNIVLAMTDDQGWGEVAYRGHKILKTPNMVQMAGNGLRLERFYVSPICSPTRAAALTGRIADRTGVFDQGRPLNLQEQKTLACALRDAGWATGLFGAILPRV